MKTLKELAKIFRDLIEPSNIYHQRAASEKVITSLISGLVKVIEGNSKRNPMDVFRGFINMRDSDTFGLGIGIVSEAEHAIRYNEGFLEILIGLDLTHCPGFYLFYASRLIRNYGTEQSIRKRFINTLIQFNKIESLTHLQRLYLYRSLLNFSINQDQVTEVPDVALKTIYKYTSKILSNLENHTKEEILLARNTKAWIFVKGFGSHKMSQADLDKKAVLLLQKNVDEQHELSKQGLAWLLTNNRVAGQNDPILRAIKLYQDVAGDTNLSSLSNLSLLYQKGCVPDVPEEEQKQHALQLASKAAHHGYLQAMFNLAFYKKEQPLIIDAAGKLDHDHRHAQQLLELVHSKGYPKADKALARLNSKIQEHRQNTDQSVASTSTHQNLTSPQAVEIKKTVSHVTKFYDYESPPPFSLSYEEEQGSSNSQKKRPNVYQQSEPYKLPRYE